jgi:hypothetical protein
MGTNAPLRTVTKNIIYQTTGTKNGIVLSAEDGIKKTKLLMKLMMEIHVVQYMAFMNLLVKMKMEHKQLEFLLAYLLSFSQIKKVEKQNLLVPCVLILHQETHLINTSIIKKMRWLTISFTILMSTF